MGNPRQRHKARSSAHKVVKHSRHAKRNLRKMKPICGPKALQEAWDKKKTLRQNYAAMGLMGSLKRTDSGGSEWLAASTVHTESEESTVSWHNSNNISSRTTTALPRGFGKILRDAEGNVIGVELPEDKAAEDVENEEVLADDDSASKTKLVQELEQLAETSRPVPRFSSNGEIAILRKLVAKHGRDFEAMAKDLRLNDWQRTAGQLQRAIKKVGLI